MHPSFQKIVLTTLLMFLAVFFIACTQQPAPTDPTKSVQITVTKDIPSWCRSDFELLKALHEVTPPVEKYLLEKQHDAEEALRECIANATVHPPSTKPKNPTQVEPIHTNISPEPTETLVVGIQKADLMPAPPIHFIPTKDDNNLWGSLVNGQIIQVVAGYIKDVDGQEHPKSAQGAVKVVVNHVWLKSKEYPTSTRHGELHFIAACGTKLTLQATDGTTFVFDAATKVYVNNAPACPTVTP